MKKSLFFILIAIMVFSSCSKDRDEDPTVLPAATQSGANTAGALIDGKIWVATKKPLNSANGSGTYCEKYNDNFIIKLDLRSDVNNYNNSIFIKVLIINLELNKTYAIINQDPNSDYNFAIYTDSSGKNYSTESNYVGSIKISRIDIQNQIVSGNFEFKAVDNNGNIVKVTDGRFDKRFD